MKIDIKENKSFVIGLLKQVDRQGVDNLIEYLKNSDYFTAPCSRKFHLNCKGGLTQHKIDVFTSLTILNNVFDIGLSDDTVILTSLLHDLCKLNLYKFLGYSDIDKQNVEYISDDKLPLGHGEKSLAIVLEFIKLSDLEKMMIRWHMGKFDESMTYEKANIIQSKFPETFMLYFADHISSLYVDVRYKHVIT